MSSSGEILVTVVVPVYNTESYIEEALSSLVNQTLKEIEIIVINDGSTDTSQEIIENFVERDGRVHLFNQPNGGLSVARNAGIARARGEYIYFMDSDDFIEKRCLESCWDFANKEKLELVTFDAKVFNEAGVEGEVANLSYSRKEKLNKNLYSGRELLEVLLNVNGYRASVPLLFFKRELLERLGLEFYPNLIHEDELFTPQLIMNCQRVGYLPEPFYNRRLREESLMTRPFISESVYHYLTVIEELRSSSLIADEDRDLIKKIASSIASSVVYSARNVGWADKGALIRGLARSGVLRGVSYKSFLVLFFPFLIGWKKRLSKS